MGDRKLYCIGEALIDFIPKQKGKQLSEVLEFERVPGGAPANVAAAVAKLGGRSSFISKLGQDAFGDAIIKTLNEVGVDTSLVVRTTEANTGLAFVSLREDGERDFSFYRNPSADMLLEFDEIGDFSFAAEDILHFCSVDLVESPIKYTHAKLIDLILDQGGLVSFDPNVRLPLWDSKEKCRDTILEFIPKAHLLKISDEELEFITGITDEEKALKSLFVGNVEAVVYTMGANGARLITKQKDVWKAGFSVSVADTTGAGDAFIGSFLYQLQLKKIGVEQLVSIDEKEIEQLLQFSNCCAALTTQNKGAISAIPTLKEMNQFLERGK